MVKTPFCLLYTTTFSFKTIYIDPNTWTNDFQRSLLPKLYYFCAPKHKTHQTATDLALWPLGCQPRAHPCQWCGHCREVCQGRRRPAGHASHAPLWGQQGRRWCGWQAGPCSVHTAGCWARRQLGSAAAREHCLAHVSESEIEKESTTYLLLYQYHSKEKDLPRICSGCAYISPHLQSRRVNLVQLVEVTVNNGVLRQTILRASGYHNCSRNLFSSGSLVIDLYGKEKKKTCLS